MVINDEDEDSNTALHLASLAGHNKVVEALLQAGADVEARNCTLWTPLDCAAAKGWEKTVRVLLEADAPVDPMDKTKTTPLHLSSSRGHAGVVELLLKWHASVVQRDSEGRNCLDLAIDNGNKDVALCIVGSVKWKDALRNETLDVNTGNRDTPMRKLIRKMPDVAEKVFHRCSQANSHNPDSAAYEITFYYEFLDDMYAQWREQDGTDALSSSGDSIFDEDNKLTDNAKPYSADSTVLKQNHPLMIMVKNEQEDLLVHPLVSSLLMHKWRSFARWVYYFNLLIYCTFLTFLTGYICSTNAPFEYDPLTAANGSTFCEVVESAQTVNQSTFAKIAKYFIIVLAGLKILSELFQIYNAKWQYFSWENLIEWVTYISALLLVIDFETCQSRTGIRQPWQWQLAAVAIFLAWIDLVLFIRKFPRFGIYVVMFTDICYTFMQFFPVFFLFIVAFALAFFVLLKNQNEFRSVLWSMLKTSVMMIGEMEYTGVFQENSMFYSELTIILFIFFMIFMNIIIMNLLVGLAVDDIKAVQEKAVLKRLAMQVELALDVESIVPQFLRRKFVRKSLNVKPNDNSNNRMKHFFQKSMFMSSSTDLNKALNPELDEMEVLQENQEKMLKNINSMRIRMKNMETSNAQLSNMLAALLKHHDVQFTDEDIVVEDATSST
ncbi:hypothetical protein CAPTEDRAFT_201917 [Capitella teleta]|uniref:Ion transport domain-containing protein n=1 Tax=Capitella teleta TaxID=283909 RepID=R7TJS6_CAPTE|nr:hypothetical protein CAPTEDRAFT_201917 [Capitella teleta]|eukprot:ELT91340.1 hypothetical protein CAPTEDRAFT_201917 [Capitella teleta]